MVFWKKGDEVVATAHQNERHRQLSHTSARDVFTNCPESHLLITALRGCYQEVLQRQDRPQNAAVSSSLFINGDPEAHPAIVTRLVSPSRLGGSRTSVPSQDFVPFPVTTSAI